MGLARARRENDERKLGDPIERSRLHEILRQLKGKQKVGQHLVLLAGEAIWARCAPEEKKVWGPQKGKPNTRDSSKGIQKFGQHPVLIAGDAMWAWLAPQEKAMKVIN